MTSLYHARVPVGQALGLRGVVLLPVVPVVPVVRSDC
jgi:hypothetical protein